MEEIRVTYDTLRVTFSFCCYMTLSILEEIRFHVDIEDRTKEKEFSFACKKKLKVYYHIYLEMLISVTHCESLVTYCESFFSFCCYTCERKFLFFRSIFYIHMKTNFVSYR